MQKWTLVNSGGGKVAPPLLQAPLLQVSLQVFSGTITPQAGTAVQFSGAWRNSTGTLNRFVFIDISPPGGNGSGQNSNIQLDNVSVNTVAPVPEPASIGLPLLGLAGIAAISRRARL